MKFFFGCTFMNRDELEKMGIQYPIKIEYYKTKTNEEKVKDENDVKYGIEIIKTTYKDQLVDIEKKTIPEIIRDERKIEQILDKLKQNKVTPISADYIIEDLLKAEC